MSDSNRDSKSMRNDGREELEKNYLPNSPSTPPSSTSTREPATMDEGSASSGPASPAARPADPAWFGSWSCDCTDVERTPAEIPAQCPTHGSGLLADDANRTRVELTHSGVSGYGVRDKNGQRP